MSVHSLATCHNMVTGEAPEVVMVEVVEVVREAVRKEAAVAMEARVKRIHYEAVLQFYSPH